MPMALPAWPKLADPALPVRLPTCRLPPGWVIAPVADVVSAPVVTVPASDKGPVTVSATAVVSVTGPLTVSPCPSVRLKPPALLALPRAVMALPVLVSVVVPADELVSAAVAMVPPVWLIVPELVSDTAVVPVRIPAVWLIPPAMLGPLDEARLIVGAVTVPDRVNGPVVLTAIERPSVTGPVTVRGWLSINANPVVVVNPPSVPIWFAPFSVAVAALPVSVGTATAPAPVSLTAPPLCRFRIDTFARFNTPTIVSGPPVGVPRVSVVAVTGVAAPIPEPPTVNPAEVEPASVTVPPAAVSEPAAPKLSALSVMEIA